MSRPWYTIARFAQPQLHKRAAALVVVCIAGAVVYGLVTRVEPTTPTTVRERFVYAIHLSGPAAAYAAFVREYASADFGLQHNSAHIFGEALYDARGLKGIATCTQTFNFGCYHGFMSRAIAREGISVVADLDRVCKSDTTAPAACEHGIGHGILEYVGHQKLIEALEACKQTRQLDPVAGCTSGVFMEYNIPLVVHENGSLSIDARPLADVRTPFDVCPTMPTTFRTSCYHELPQWWQQVFTKDIRVMGATCVQNANSKEAQACLQGIANIIPSQAGYSPDVAQTMCDSMPTTRSREECLVNAAWGFVKNFNMPEAASKLCEGLSDDMQHRCPT